MTASAQVLAVDVLVVGAGTAGLGAAVQLARRGRRVVVVEGRPLGQGGARWCNGVVPWQFTRAGFSQPVAPEARGTGGAIRVAGPDGSSFVVDHDPVVETDMRLLNQRLLDEALELGVEVIDRVSTPQVELRHGRVIGARIERDGGTALAVDASLVVDASGRAAVMRRQVPDLDRWCPDPRPDELCSAAQTTCSIADRDGARRFLEQLGLRAGDTAMWLGFAGGFSALAIHVDAELEQVGVLTGTLGDGRWGSGRSILDLARRRHPWIGDPIFGGSGLIPLQAPYARFTSPGLALVGDAASQVFPAHGSGIGVGLIAGVVLAEAIDRTASAEPGDEATLWRYQSAFMRELGGTLAAYDHVRRLSTAVGSSGVATLVRTGLVDAESTAAGLVQDWVVPTPQDLARRAVVLARHPGLAAHAAPRLAAATAAPAWYQRYPIEVDTTALRRWARLAAIA